MLLTVADPPALPCELQVKYDELHRVDPWLKQDDGSLDGVYLQYEKEMATPEGAARLRELSQRHLVGVWAHAHRDPDDFETFQVRCICPLSSAKFFLLLHFVHALFDLISIYFTAIHQPDRSLLLRLFDLFPHFFARVCVCTVASQGRELLVCKHRPPEKFSLGGECCELVFLNRSLTTVR